VNTISIIITKQRVHRETNTQYLCYTVKNGNFNAHNNTGFNTTENK